MWEIVSTFLFVLHQRVFFLPTVVTIKLKKKLPTVVPCSHLCPYKTHRQEQEKLRQKYNVCSSCYGFIIIVVVLVFIVDFSVANETPLVCQYYYKQISS